VSAEIRWGVVGPGRIAEKVVEDFAVVDGARAVAVASRSLDRAEAFAGKHGLERAYGSYAEIIADGAIGEVRSVQADLGVQRDFDPADRLFAPELGGGALLDLGVYVVSFAQMLLGTPSRVVAAGSLFPSGADAEASLLLDHGDGRTATLTTSLRNALPGQARVFGTAGWIDVLPRFHHPETIVLHRAGAEPETITRTPLGAGYAHELIEVTEGVRAGRSESAVMPLSDTLAVQSILGEAAEQLGVRHAEDPAVLAQAGAGRPGVF